MMDKFKHLQYTPLSDLKCEKSKGVVREVITLNLSEFPHLNTCLNPVIGESCLIQKTYVNDKVEYFTYTITLIKNGVIELTKDKSNG